MQWEYFHPVFEVGPEDVSSPWSGHRFFAYDLVRNLKPRRVVELGTYLGTSFFSFAQAAKDGNLATEVNAVDNWLGDIHGGFYDESVFQQVQQEKDKNFSNIKIHLLRKSFDDAVSDFENKSIDLLHIDGLHTYDAVKYDFETWFSKVSDDGIILFHDINEKGNEFGVYKFWSELTRQYVTFEFYHGHGLGVLFKSGNNTLIPLFRNLFTTWQQYYYNLYAMARLGDRLRATSGLQDQNVLLNNQLIKISEERAELLKSFEEKTVESALLKMEYEKKMDEIIKKQEVQNAFIKEEKEKHATEMNILRRDLDSERNKFADEMRMKEVSLNESQVLAGERARQIEQFKNENVVIRNELNFVKSSKFWSLRRYYLKLQFLVPTPGEFLKKYLWIIKNEILKDAGRRGKFCWSYFLDKGFLSFTMMFWRKLIEKTKIERKSLKVYYILHALDPNLVTGTERFTLNQAKAQKKNCSVKIVAYGVMGNEFFDHEDGDFFIKQHVCEGVEVLSIRQKDRVIYKDPMIEIADTYDFALKFLKAEKPDLLHITHTIRMSGFVKAALDLGIPYILTLTDYYLLCPHINLLTEKGALCLGANGGEECRVSCASLEHERISDRFVNAAAILGGAQKICSPSHFLAGMFKKKHPDLEFNVLPHGLNFSFLGTNEKHYNRNSRIRFVYLGVLVPYKGVHILINAFKDLKNSEAELFLYGQAEPRYLEELKGVAQDNPRIHFMGRYNQSDLKDILQENDVMIFPTICYDNYPQALCEALASRVPVICSDFGGAAERVEPGVTGFHFKTGDSVSLMNVMKEIIESPQKLNGLKQNLDRLKIPTIEEEAQQYFSIYNAVLKNGISKTWLINSEGAAERGTRGAERITTDFKTLPFRIFTPPATLYLARNLRSVLNRFGLNAEIVSEVDDLCDNYLYIMICPWTANKIPKHYVAYQMEQTISDRWFTEAYFTILKNALCVFDYSIKNIEFLLSKGFSYKDLFYMPVGYLAENSAKRNNSDYAYDVLFYGDPKSPRRQKMLEKLQEKFKVKVVCGLYGEELYRELPRARIVVNIHYYENALLETTRLYECLAQGAIVVSERGSDQEYYAELENYIDFVDCDDVEALIKQVQFWKEHDIEISQRVESYKNLLQKDSVIFFLGRFLLSYGFIDFDRFYAETNRLFDLKNKFCFVGLPEAYPRYQYLLKELLPQMTSYQPEFLPGIRNSNPVVGGALSYKYLFRMARQKDLSYLAILEDDVGLLPGFDQVINAVLNFIKCPENCDKWDVISFFMAEFNDDYEVRDVFMYQGVRFVEVSRMISTVFNIYNKTMFDKLKDWRGAENSTENILDRYLQKRASKILLVFPYVVEHLDRFNSTTWAFNGLDFIPNTNYRAVIDSAKNNIAAQLWTLGQKKQDQHYEQ